MCPSDAFERKFQRKEGNFSLGQAPSTAARAVYAVPDLFRPGLGVQQLAAAAKSTKEIAA